jgi:lipopolysaccharide export system protein LptC
MSAADHSDGAPVRERLSFIAPVAPKAAYNQRYSSFVRAGKLALPLIGVALLSVAIAWPTMRAKLAGFVDFVPAAIDAAIEDYQVTKMTMRGKDKNDQPYTFTAETAMKYDPDVAEIDLLRPNADIGMRDGSWLALMADRGRYDKDADTLMLFDNVNMFRDDGFEVNTSSAVIDLQTGAASGSEPIQGHGEFGEMEGKGGFHVSDDGEDLLLLGPARLKIYPKQRDSL